MPLEQRFALSFAMRSVDVQLRMRVLPKIVSQGPHSKSRFEIYAFDMARDRSDDTPE